ncbi:hypothetical protein CBS147332_4122 [Penicillium roqueforti]|nr:hypothetical protein CBS147332_4122 [Penicillium roqueforti]KAI3108983.1 hypothetical protein CBS147331_5775 [Penicillium roqueforti]
MSLGFNVNVSAQQLVDILPVGIAILDHHYKAISASSRFQELIPCPKSDSANAGYNQLIQMIMNVRLPRCEMLRKMGKRYALNIAPPTRHPFGAP